LCIYSKCKLPTLLAEAIYTNSAHQCLDDKNKITKETHLITGTVVWKVRWIALTFDMINPSSIPRFSELILPVTHIKCLTSSGKKVFIRC